MLRMALFSSRILPRHMRAISNGRVLIARSAPPSKSASLSLPAFSSSAKAFLTSACHLSPANASILPTSPPSPFFDAGVAAADFFSRSFASSLAFSSLSRLTLSLVARSSAASAAFAFAGSGFAFSSSSESSSVSSSVSASFSSFLAAAGFATSCSSSSSELDPPSASFLSAAICFCISFIFCEAAAAFAALAFSFSSLAFCFSSSFSFLMRSFSFSSVSFFAAFSVFSFSAFSVLSFSAFSFLTRSFSSFSFAAFSFFTRSFSSLSCSVFSFFSRSFSSFSFSLANFSSAFFFASLSFLAAEAVFLSLASASFASSRSVLSLPSLAGVVGVKRVLPAAARFNLSSASGADLAFFEVDCATSGAASTVSFLAACSSFLRFLPVPVPDESVPSVTASTLPGVAAPLVGELGGATMSRLWLKRCALSASLFLDMSSSNFLSALSPVSVSITHNLPVCLLCKSL
mmetsp:Transcript_14331/g.20862  ORF Transcript_14331/g.20862 Transcript_14331/m.20862 type:complete len:461 (-) Transcript_14331:552-1934(-)